MTEALKCPECAASLEYPADGGNSMRCPYCNSTVLLTGHSRPTPAVNFGTAFGATTANAGQLAEVIERLRAGDKIGAIRVYRRICNVGLSDAKTAVEKLAGQHQLDAGRMPSPAKVMTSVLTLVVVLGGGIALFTAAILFFVFRTVHHQLATVNHTLTHSMGPTYVPMRVPTSPAIAHMALEFGSEGIGAGGFNDARSIATDGQGHFYVGDYSDGRIQVFDATGKFISTWSIGHDKNLLNLAADRNGAVYAVIPGHIYRYEGATGNLLGEAETRYEDTQEYYCDAFASLDGDTYAVANNSSIVDIGPNGLIKRVIDAHEKVGENLDFTRVLVLGTGEIFAMDRSKGVFKFAPDGRYINRFGGGQRQAPGHLLSPNNMAADGKGRIYVSDIGSAVQVFDDEGTSLGSFGGFDVVYGLAITDQNEIYGCFRNLHTVRKYVLEKK